jgi:hypothetical protein
MATLVLILNLIPALIKAIAAIEEALPVAGAGKEKLGAIKEIITTTYTAGTEIWPTVEKVIGVLVGLFNKTGAFAK